MKRYYNETTKEWYYEGKSMTRQINNSCVFSGVPSVEHLTEWGFVEWVEPAPTPQELLDKAKRDKITELEEYDNSSAVNEFTIGGSPMWLTHDERAQISQSITAYKATGATSMTKWFNGVAYTFELTAWEYMLNTLLVYASEALNVTESHKAAINALTDVEDVEGYDFTTGYPNKLAF